MKKIFLMVVIFLSVNVFAKNYIRVEGHGSNLEIAKEKAFREAIQIAAGTIVLSQRITTMQDIKQDNISVYSAGYITDFKIIRVSNNNNEVHVILDVLVSESKMFNQVLNSGGTDKPFNGNNVHGAATSYLNQRRQADHLLHQLLNTYPENAYNLKTKSYTIYIDSDRNTILSIPFKLNWNYDFIVAFNEAMHKLNDSNFSFYQTAPGNVYVMAKNPKDYIIGERSHFKFKDVIFLENLKKYIENNELRLQLILRNNQYDVIYKNCFVPQGIRGHMTPFYDVTNANRITIYGNTAEETELQLTVPSHRLHLLKQVSHIELLPVSNKKCVN